MLSNLSRSQGELSAETIRQSAPVLLALGSWRNANRACLSPFSVLGSATAEGEAATRARRAATDAQQTGADSVSVDVAHHQTLPLCCS